MIVVDSSVWIDWIKGADNADTDRLAACHPNDILVGDIVLLEVLRGAADERHAHGLEVRLRQYEVLSMLDGPLATRAAANYRRLRSLGVTVRATSDLIIGTFCIERDHLLLQKDRDYVPMAENLGLRLA